jgi:hypothetical protein
MISIDGLMSCSLKLITVLGDDEIDGIVEISEKERMEQMVKENRGSVWS